MFDPKSHYTGRWYAEVPRQHWYVTLERQDGTLWPLQPWNDELKFKFIFTPPLKADGWPDTKAVDNIKRVKIVNIAEEELWSKDVLIEMTELTTLNFDMSGMVPFKSHKRIFELRDDYLRLKKRFWRSIDDPWEKS